MTNVNFDNCLTLIACCMKSIAMSMPNNSPAIRVKRLMMEHAPKMASKNSIKAVHKHTLQNQDNNENKAT